MAYYNEEHNCLQSYPVPTGDGWRVATPEDIERATNPPKSKEQVQAEYTAFLQGMLDAKAKEYGYDSIATAVTYADEPTVPRFQEEGRAFRAWRSALWAKGYEIIAQVEAGERSLPTAQELAAEMPAFSIPYQTQQGPV